LEEGLVKEASEVFGGFKIGQVICTVIYADDLVLLGKEEACYRALLKD
jgi:hypothetical protein